MALSDDSFEVDCDFEYAISDQHFEFPSVPKRRGPDRDAAIARQAQMTDDLKCIMPYHWHPLGVCENASDRKKRLAALRFMQAMSANHFDQSDYPMYYGPFYFPNITLACYFKYSTPTPWVVESRGYAVFQTRSKTYGLIIVRSTAPVAGPVARPGA